LDFRFGRALAVSCPKKAEMYFASIEHFFGQETDQMTVEGKRLNAQIVTEGSITSRIEQGFKRMTEKLMIDKEAIRELAAILVETDLSEIEYENDGRRIRVARTVNVVASVPQGAVAIPSAAPALYSAAPSEHEKVDKVDEHAIKSPMVGTVYLAPDPSAAHFVKVGDSVSMGQTLMIIEAMKVMNPIKAPRSGKIAHIYVRDAQPVEFGEPLLSIH
jgi:acetyl-CoA carboxylase biotin carboxyl carrier protein